MNGDVRFADRLLIIKKQFHVRRRLYQPTYVGTYLQR